MLAWAVRTVPTSVYLGYSMAIRHLSINFVFEMNNQLNRSHTHCLHVPCLVLVQPQKSILTGDQRANEVIEQKGI